MTYNINDPIEEFKENSPGIYFYFYFIKQMAFVFIVICLLSIIPLVLNILGGSLSKYGKTNFLMDTTLGNIKGLEFTDEEKANMELMDP